MGQVSVLDDNRLHPGMGVTACQAAEPLVLQMFQIYLHDVVKLVRFYSKFCLAVCFF